MTLIGRIGMDSTRRALEVDHDRAVETTRRHVEKDLKSLAFAELPILAGVVQWDFLILVGLERIHQAALEWRGVNVQAHCALVELSEIQDSMNKFCRVYLGRKKLVNLNCIRGLQTAITTDFVLIDHAEVLHKQPAHGNRHPAILILVIVNLRALSLFPAHCNQRK